MNDDPHRPHRERRIRPIRPDVSIDASDRAGISAAFGLGVGTFAAFFAPWQLTLLIAFDIAALVQLLWVWVPIARMDAEQTSGVATREDNSRRLAHVLVNSASLMSLTGVALALVKAKTSDEGLEVALTVAAVATVILAWATVHTVFILRYAHLYYEGPDGGIEFGADETPDYLDFAYLGFTVGMTYQVSDTNVTDRAIRRTVMHHALISFVFGTVIIGVTINVTAGFIR
jgi:uncharacterized membrane protein